MVGYSEIAKALKQGVAKRSDLASPINPVELAGGYLHLRPAPGILQPGQSDRETRVQVAKV